MRPIIAKAIGYMKPDIDPNTRLYVPFNEGVGNVAKDYSQYGNHAQLTDVEWSPDGFNGAGKFNGSSSFGACSDDPSLNITDAITIEAWLKVINLSWYMQLAIKGHTNVGGYQLKLGPSDEIIYRSSSAGANQETRSSAGDVIDDTWCYIAATQTGALAKIYKDGVDVTSFADSHLNPGASEDNLCIGKYHTDAASLFHGTIGNMVISSIARSAAQIAADCYEVVCN